MFKNKTQSVAVEQTQQQANAGSLFTAIILDHVKNNCEDFNNEYSKIGTESHTSENYLKLFHWPGATYITSSMFEGIKDLLSSYKGLISSRKTVDNLADQISFLNTIKILSSNFMALSYCGIKLP